MLSEIRKDDIIKPAANALFRYIDTIQRKNAVAFIDLTREFEVIVKFESSHDPKEVLPTLVTLTKPIRGDVVQHQNQYTLRVPHVGLLHALKGYHYVPFEACIQNSDALMHHDFYRFMKNSIRVSEYTTTKRLRYSEF